MSKEGDNIFTIMKFPITILAILIAILIAKYFSIDFSNVKSIEPNKVEFYEEKSSINEKNKEDIQNEKEVSVLDEREKTKNIAVKEEETNESNTSYYEASGSCIIDTDKYETQTQANLMAIKCAIIVAKAELIELIEGVVIKNDIAIKDYMIQSSDIKAKVQGIIKQAEQIGEPIIKDNKVQIILRVNKKNISKLIL